MTALEFSRVGAHNAPMTEKHPSRPRDLNQWAKRMLDIATGEVSDAPREAEKKAADAAPKTKIKAPIRPDAAKKA